MAKPRKVHENRASGLRPQPRSRSRAGWFWFLVSAAYLAAIVWTSVAYAVENRATANSVAFAGPVAALRTTYVFHGRAGIRAYVQNRARAAGVDPKAAAWIVAHESGNRPSATGDGGDSRGLWQIDRVYHPEVSDDCAYDVECSTRWSLKRIRDGNINEWSTWKQKHGDR